MIVPIARTHFEMIGADCDDPDYYMETRLKIRNIILSITDWKWQARRKQFRVSPAGRREYARGGPGACSPGKF